jgi:hypothetical membrane protein
MKIAIRSQRFAFPGAVIATAGFALAVAAFGASLEGYSQAVHAVDVLGATGVPGAAWFNALAFVVPGLLVAAVGVASWLQRPRLAPKAARIGALIELFSALAFVALGVFPLDLYRFDAASSRLHAMAWSLWWLSIATGALLAFTSSRGRAGGDPLRWASLALAWSVPGFALFAPAQWGSAIPQRMAFAAWFAWWLLAAFAVSRTAASAPGSSPPAGT